MAGIAEESDALMKMVGEAVERLYNVNPEHELLGYIKGIDNDEVYAGFVERFGKKDIPEHQRASAKNTAWMWNQYLVAVKRELGELPIPAPEEPKPAPDASLCDQNIPF